jgi:N-acetylmuramoyl-L-alanine amidase
VADAEPIRGTTVVLDPGHGGSDTGATGAAGLAEKDVNLAVAEHAKRALEAEGTTVVLTRTGDHPMTIAARAAVATALQPAAVVSVHHNGGPHGHSNRPGTETYYQRGSPDSRRLAGLVYEDTVAYFSRHVGVTWHANPNPGAKYQLNLQGDDYFGILRLSAGVPVVLSEGLFLSSSESEARLLADPDIQREEGHAIARAVRRFLLTDDPGSGYVESVPWGHSGDGGRAGCEDPPLE